MKSLFQLLSVACVCVCVNLCFSCVCVCEREREREREPGCISTYVSIQLLHFIGEMMGGKET